ncbi:MAG: hypothetical protein NDJ72_08365 [Elusimicrobia bacterium]|nr:hypothetical protein [Elusimicrobiota bacterium]
MRPSALLAAALLAALAAPSFAGAPSTPEKDPAAPPPYQFPKHDFTQRPHLRPYAPRDKAAAGTPLKHDQAKALSGALFDNYQNVSGLSLFRFHTRTKDEPAMTLEEITWADEALARETKLFDELQAEVDAAYKAGIERRAPVEGDRSFAKGMMFLGRLKYIGSRKPTLDELRRGEYEAISSIGLSLSVLLRDDSEPAAQTDAKARAEAEKNLAESRADLTESRKRILAFRQEDAERDELRSSSILDAKERVKRAAGAALGEAKKASEALPRDDAAPTAAPAPAPSGRTAEQISRELNALPRAAPSLKRKPAAVPAP